MSLCSMCHWNFIKSLYFHPLNAWTRSRKNSGLRLGLQQVVSGRPAWVAVVPRRVDHGNPPVTRLHIAESDSLIAIDGQSASSDLVFEELTGGFIVDGSVELKHSFD